MFKFSKIVSLIMLASMLLAACGGATQTPAATQPPPATEAPATEMPATEMPATEMPATEMPATEAPAAGAIDCKGAQQGDETVQGALRDVIAHGGVDGRAGDHHRAAGDEQPLQRVAGPDLAGDHEEAGGEQQGDRNQGEELPVPGGPQGTPWPRSISSSSETASSRERRSWPVTASRRRAGSPAVWTGLA